jgi:hypothetical protein
VGELLWRQQPVYTTAKILIIAYNRLFEENKSSYAGDGDRSELSTPGVRPCVGGPEEAKQKAPVAE